MVNFPGNLCIWTGEVYRSSSIALLYLEGQAYVHECVFEHLENKVMTSMTVRCLGSIASLEQ